MNGYTVREQKIRVMSVGEVRLHLATSIMKDFCGRRREIRMVNTTTGDVDIFENLETFLVAEFNDSYEVVVTSIKTVESDRDIKYVVVFEEV